VFYILLSTAPMMPQWVLPACCLSLSYLQSGLIALLLHSPPNYHSVPAPPPEALDPELDAARKNVVNGIEDVVSFSEQGTMVLQIRYVHPKKFSWQVRMGVRRC